MLSTRTYVREEQVIEDETNMAKLELDDETHTFCLRVFRKWYEEWHSVDDRKWKGSFEDKEDAIVCTANSEDYAFKSGQSLDKPDNEEHYSNQPCFEVYTFKKLKVEGSGGGGHSAGDSAVTAIQCSQFGNKFVLSHK
eukprot:TRINITY_DN1238_c0_g1_i1.p1 TRINITY_DN1238_c0_g1~~TRINITY_DN1238_c0_g1_i1.p1  ORF type:complete len:138 (+),score=30.95 TRINITY_DN1238_c0_g1_i1:154-567(+)